jgi:hypothetical protein
MRLIWLPVVVALVFLACSAPAAEPAIGDPAQLKAACGSLLQDSTLTTIDREKWPEAIKKLNPVAVRRDGDAIYITTFANTGIGARGYVVATTKPPSNEHYTVSDTPYSGIYLFDFTP